MENALKMTIESIFTVMFLCRMLRIQKLKASNWKKAFRNSIFAELFYFDARAVHLWSQSDRKIAWISTFNSATQLPPDEIVNLI